MRIYAECMIVLALVMSMAQGLPRDAGRLPGTVIDRPGQVSLDGDWRVHIPVTYDPDAYAEPPAADDQRWVALDQSRTREFRLADYYEPGQPFWLEKSFDVPAGLRGKTLVIHVPNRITFHRARLNGHQLEDISHDAFHLPETNLTRQIPDRYPKFTGIRYKWERKDLRLRRYEHFSHLFNHYGQPARLLVKPQMLKAAGNRLTLQVWDYDHPQTQTLTGPITLAEPSLDDALLPFAYSRPAGEFEVEGVAGLDARLPGRWTATGQVEVFDNLGKRLRSESVTLKVGDGPAEIVVPRRSHDAYRAKVTWRWGDQQLPPQWIYFVPQIEHTADLRTRYNLEGADWQFRVVHEAGSPKFPLGEDKWVPTYAPATQISNAEHYLKKVVHHILLRKKFDLPADFHGERVVLRVGGSSINYKLFGKQDPDTKVYLNGKNLGTFAFDQSTVSFDVTDIIRRQGGNELVMTPTRYVRGTLEIVGVPAVRVAKQWVIPSVSDGQLTVRSWVTNDSDQARTIELHHAVRGKAGQALTFDKPMKVTIKPGQTRAVESSQPWADAELWSPWSPVLYELQTALKADGQTLDRRHDRFGFREFGIDGENITVNGQVLHLRGENGLFHPNHFGRVDMSMIANRMHDSKRAGYNMSRESDGVPSLYWRMCDDFGFLGNFNAGPSDMGRGWVIKQPEAFFDAVNAMFTTYIDDNYNHPSIILWNYGNELPAPRSGYLENQIIEALNEIKAFDPTRLVTADGTHLPMEKVETVNPHYAASPYYAWGAETIETEIIPRTGAYIMDPHQRSYWLRNKPLICGEYNWAHTEISTSDFYQNYGEQQMKPTRRLTPDLEGDEPPYYVALTMGYIKERREDTKWFRAGGISGMVLLNDGFVSHDMVDPIAGAFFGENRRFWSGQPFRQWLSVFNDVGDKAEIKLELRYGIDGEVRTQWQQTVTLDQGGRAMVEAQCPAITVDQPTRLRAELVVWHGGEVVDREYRRWEVFPRDWVERPAGVSVAVYDPSGFAQELFEPIGVKTESLFDVAQAGQCQADLLVLGEDLDVQLMNQAAVALRQYVRGGGTLLVLRQEEIRWLPVEVEPEGHGRKGKHDDLSQAVMLGTTHPIFTDLLPEDLADWGRFGVVAARDYGMVREGTLRSLTDVGSLLEAIEEDGRYLITTLELTPENVKNEPVVAKLLANIVRHAGMPVQAPAKTLVYSGGEGKRARAMQRDFRMQADFRTQAPESLDDYELVILCDWADDSPSGAFGDELKAFAQAGGTVLVQQVSPAMQNWLARALDVSMKDREVITRRAVTLRPDPLLEGIGDVHMGWWNTAKRDSYLQSKPSGNDIIRREVMPAGGRQLTWPGVLATCPVGEGQLVIDQSRWTEITGERRFYWSKDSRAIADKYAATLLINAGAYMDYRKKVEVAVVARNVTRDLIGAEFHPIDLGTFVNRSRTDTKANDGRGWIDLGSGYDLSKLSAGTISAQGVPFEILEESKHDGRSVIMLRGEQKLTDLPDQTDNIPIGRKADAICFLHTAAYVDSPRGTSAWEYEVHYEGYGKMIYGSDVTEFISTAPVKVELDVDDWHSDDPAIDPAWSAGGGANSTAANLYLLRWSNPRPDVPIESFMVRSKRAAEVPILLAATVAVKPQYVFEPGQLEPGRGDFPEGWSVGKSWMKGGANVMSEGGQRFLRLTTPGVSMSAPAPLPAGTKNVTLTTRVRLQDYRQGTHGWDCCSLLVGFTDAGGKDVGNAWKHGLKFRKDQDWQDEQMTVQVPEGAVRMQVTIGQKAEAAKFDIQPIVLTPSGASGPGTAAAKSPPAEPAAAKSSSPKPSEPDKPTASTTATPPPSTGSEGANLFAPGAFEPGRRKFPEGWAADKGWMKGNAKVISAEGKHFLRINGAPVSIGADAPLGENTDSVTVAIPVRLQNYQQGQHGWDNCNILVSFLDTDGEPLNEAWKQGMKFRADQPWSVESKSYAVPEGTQRIRIELNHKAAAGTFDIGPISVTAE